MDSVAPDWIAETKFGKWFLSTDIWLKYVLSDAIIELRTLAGDQITAGGRLLDIGCGQGAAFLLLQQAFAPAELIGVDVDHSMITRARTTALRIQSQRWPLESSLNTSESSSGHAVATLRNGAPPQQICKVAASASRIEVCEGSVTHLNIAANSIDLVFCHQLIHHVAAQERALSELFRVLKPGGSLLLGESCASFINSWPVRWFFRHPMGVQRTAEAYIAMVRTAGFSVQSRHTKLFTPWWSLPDFGLRRRLGIISNRDTTTELLLVAKKPLTTPG